MADDVSDWLNPGNVPKDDVNDWLNSQQPPPSSFSGSIADLAYATIQPARHILQAFNQGATDGWGVIPHALGEDQQTALKTAGIHDVYKQNHEAQVKGFNEAFIRPIVQGVHDAAWAPFKAGAAALFGLAEAGKQTAKEISQRTKEIEEAYRTQGVDPDNPTTILGNPSLLVNKALGGLSEIIGASSSGEYIGGEHALPHSDQYVKPFIKGIIDSKSETVDLRSPFFHDPSTYRTFTIEDMLKARAEGKLGEGEEGFFNTRPVTEDTLKSRAEAAKTAGIPPIIPKPPVTDIHELARQVDPYTFQLQDELVDKINTIRADIESFGESPGDKVAERLAAKARLQETYAKLDELSEDTDSAYDHARSLLPDLEAERDKKYLEDVALAQKQTEEPLTESSIKTGKEPPGPLKPPGTIRYYYGSPTDPTTGGDRWATPDYQYARDYRSGDTPNPVYYVDVPKGHPFEISTRQWDEADGEYAGALRGTYRSAKLPEELDQQLKLLPEPQEAPGMASTAPEGPGEGAGTSQPGKPATTPPEGTLRSVQGTGETKVMGLSRNLMERAIEQGLTDKFPDLPEYDVLHRKDQAVLVANYLSTNYEEAKQLLLNGGKFPEGIHPESLLLGVRARAEAERDLPLIMRLATDSRITREENIIGQRLSMLADRDPDSPTSVIREVYKAKQARAKDSAKISEVRKKGVQDIKSKINKKFTKEDLVKYLKDNECDY